MGELRVNPGTLGRSRVSKKKTWWLLGSGAGMVPAQKASVSALRSCSEAGNMRLFAPFVPQTYEYALCCFSRGSACCLGLLGGESWL